MQYIINSITQYMVMITQTHARTVVLSKQYLLFLDEVETGRTVEDGATSLHLTPGISP